MRGPAILVQTLTAVAIIVGWSVSANAQQEPRSDLGTETTEQRSGDEQVEPTTPIPPITEADRTAAFPNVEPQVMRDRAVHAFVLFDQLEWQGDGTEGGMNWDTKGWVGGDRTRLWFRTEGQVEDGDLDEVEAHLLYGRAVARWWDVVVGVRQDIRPGPAQTWGAFGLQGLAPYWFEVEATGYISDGGQTAARLEADYELLLTNRLVLRPLVEVNLYGKSNTERGIGAGLSSADIELRMRYEFRRELAPYIGVTWNHLFGETRNLAEAAGGTASRIRFVGGLRLWY